MQSFNTWTYCTCTYTYNNVQSATWTLQVQMYMYQILNQFDLYHSVYIKFYNFQQKIAGRLTYTWMCIVHLWTWFVTYMYMYNVQCMYIFMCKSVNTKFWLWCIKLTFIILSWQTNGQWSATWTCTCSIQHSAHCMYKCTHEHVHVQSK